MPTLLDDWQRMRLSADPASEPGYALELRVSRPGIRVFLALQQPGQNPALVVELPAAIRPQTLSSFSTRAFEVVLAAFPGLPDGHIGIAIDLMDASFDDLFAMLADEILAAVSDSSSPDQAVQAINRCIARWRRFVDSGRRSLTDEEVRGLIGELAVLGRLSRRIGFLNALAAWRAPLDSIRDFELDNSSLEVKTYQVQAGPSLRINDPAQLEPSPERPLHLCAVRLAPTDAGRTLPEVIQLICDTYSSQQSGITQLEDLLASYGYLASQARTYTDRFSIGPVHVFAVGEGFPRIRPLAVPAGVEDVRFAIPIGALARYEVSADEVLGPPASTLEAGS